MGKYSLAKAHKRTFNKTMAIALAAGVSLGGVTIPQFTGVESVTAVASAAESEKISPASPFPDVKETTFDREYNLADAKPGSRTLLRVLASSADIQNGEIVIPGLFEGIPDDKISSIDGSYESNHDEPFARGKDYPSGVKGVKSIRVEENGDFVLSLLPGAKRVVNYIAVILSDNTILIISPAVGTREHAGLNFVTKNPDGTISGELEERHMSHLVADGDTYEFGAYGFPLLGQEPGVEVEPYDFNGNDTEKFIAGGITARIPEQGVWEIDNDAGTIKFTPEPDFKGTPIFPRIGLVDIFNASGLIYTPAQSEAQGTDVAPLPDVMKQYTFIDMQYVMPEEYRKEAEKDRDFNPNTSDTNPSEDPHNDIYIDGEPDVAEDGTVTLHRNDGKDITFKVPTGSKVEVNKDGDLVITQPDGKKETVPLKHTTVTESGKPGTPDHKIIITDENGDTHEFGTYDKFLKSVKDDGKGNYTFIMNDGTKLGPIKLGDDITNIVDDGKGNLIVTHKDGSKDTVPLTHTTITEEGKPGEDGYKITLTTPDGKKVTLDGYDNYVESIKKQPNGDYLVKRNDGTEWTIKLSDIRKDIKNLKGKDAEQDKRLDDLENRVDGIDEEIENLGDRITKNEGAIEDHRKSINDLNQKVGDINNELGDIKDELARLDGQDIKEVRDNGDGTYTLIRNNGDEVTGTIDTSSDIKAIADNGDGTITLTHNDGSTEVVDLTHTTVETKGKPGDKDYTVTITTPDGNKVTLNGSNTYPSKVKDNGDGTYTIILNDGTEVPGKIGDGQDIKELVPNEDGTMTVIHKDGTESKVDLKQVTITEENKGTPEHTVTITSPNGDSVTFNVFDKYVTNVVKNENGDYDIYRSDIDGGNTVWKTIVLSDLRDKIAALEDRADKLEEKDADLQKQIDDLKGRLDKAESDIQDLDGRTSDLEKAVSKINARLSVIELNITALETRMTALEGRVDTVETTQHAWAQCFSGVLGTAIPLLAAVPFVAGSNIQIPGAAQWNNQIQRTLGIYNEKLNRMAGQYSGVVKAAALVLGVAGTIGLGVHTAKACGPYSKTDAMKDTKAGQLSSKVTAKREGSSREK